MGFEFNPSLWFICRLCRLSFASTETLKDHKLACHLGECLQVKYIVFEERILTEEWIPEQNLSENQNRVKDIIPIPKNRNTLNVCRDIIQPDFATAREASFKNPYISLTRITDERTKLPSSSGQTRRKKKVRRNKLLLQSDPEIYSSKNYNDDDNLNSEEEFQLKKESLIDDAPTAANLVRNEDADTNSHDVKDQELLVAVDSPNSDAVPHAPQAPTLTVISAFDQKSQFLQLQQQHQTISNTKLNPVTTTTITESEYQQLISDDVTTDVEIKLNTWDSDLISTSFAEQICRTNPTQEHQEPQIGGSIQHQQSASVINFQRTATGEEVAKPFMCETCFAFFPTNTQLKSHMLCHSSLKPFQCSQCPASFKRKSTLGRHQIVHGMETKFKCRFCFKCFSDNMNLHEHERSHTGHKPFKCPVPTCFYVGSTKGNLMQHTRSVHNEELGLQQFVCPTCGKAYGVRKYLHRHIRENHSGATPLHCTHQGCGRTFRIKLYLIRHLRKHHGI